jgi:hypothetical protein
MVTRNEIDFVAWELMDQNLLDAQLVIMALN